VFADENARQEWLGELVVYDVEMLDTSSAEGALYTGVTHLYPGKVGNEYFMTRGHFHEPVVNKEVYFGLRGVVCCCCKMSKGNALEGICRIIHIIPGFTAHRLINTGEEVRFPRWRSGPASRVTITRRWPTALNKSL
jgi:glucose-6-phosphate isomerase